MRVELLLIFTIAALLGSATAMVLIHSDQGSQPTRIDWALFLRQRNLEHSMSPRGNCHDNTVAESFLSPLKRERIRH